MDRLWVGGESLAFSPGLGSERGSSDERRAVGMDQFKVMWLNSSYNLRSIACF